MWRIGFFACLLIGAFCFPGSESAAAKKLPPSEPVEEFLRLLQRAVDPNAEAIVNPIRGMGPAGEQGSFLATAQGIKLLWFEGEMKDRTGDALLTQTMELMWLCNKQTDKESLSTIARQNLDGIRLLRQSRACSGSFLGQEFTMFRDGILLEDGERYQTLFGGGSAEERATVIKVIDQIVQALGDRYR